MRENGQVEEFLKDSAYLALKRKSSTIRWLTSILAVLAYGSYSWLTGYAGGWFSQPLLNKSSISIGLTWIAGSIFLLVLSEVLYEWYCRKRLDPLRAELAAKYPGRTRDESD
jgi:uncharacterized membrane protein (DUF485 family)